MISVLFSPDPRAGAIELVRQSYLVAIYIVIVLAVRQGLATTVATGLASSGAVLAAVGVIALVIQAVFGVGTDRIGPVMTLPYLGPTLRLNALTVSPAMFACVLAVSVPFVMLHPAIAASRARSWLAGFVMAIATAMTFSHSVAGVAVSAVTASWQRLRGAIVTTGRRRRRSHDRDRPQFCRHGVDSIHRRLSDSRQHDLSIRGGWRSRTDRRRRRRVPDDELFPDQAGGVGRVYQPAADGHRPRSIPRDHGSGLSRRPAHRARIALIDPHSTLMGRLAEAGLIGGVTLIMFWIVIAREVRQ